MIDAQTAFVAASLVIALLIWVESGLLERNDGKLPETGIFGIASLLTSVWVLVSAAALYFLELDRFAISVPVVYGIYSVAGWFYGAKLIAKTDVPDDPMDIIVPAKYLAFSKSFALVYGLLCVFVLASPRLALAI
ncbi:hypothetical protein B0181_08495 [Moraxella caviae]|uniref:Uncharacterized protein n=1 Tax=Moraxella caviae TaxID=34060 RepID=A0A1S9ZXT0_9GAMM|nr:hypothetical protein [Moraxella caviae]OOR88270.1 hypothetical protein B0181_08495 [Moraxella caviae]STZ13895.1 Uncharacterised protein [Moraxella caviae]